MRALLFCIAIAASGCGPRPFQFPVSAVTPAATGTVTTNVGPNGNTRVAIRVQHLAAPNRVSADATVYMAWAVPLEAGRAAQTLGALEVDGELDGALQSVTTLKSFQLSITAEPSAHVDKPTGKQVLAVIVTAR